MAKNKSWTYIIFGAYPLGLFNLANSDLNIIKQLLILISIILGIVMAVYIGGVLSIKYLIFIMLVVISPYVIGRL